MRWRTPLVLVLSLALAVNCQQNPTAPETDAFAVTPTMNGIPGGNGRMTGGGDLRLGGYAYGEFVEVRFTSGFTVHCDVALSNNLAISWAGFTWKLERESLEDVSCIDVPDVNPEPVPASFDTFIANAFGSLRTGSAPGIQGSYIAFILQDAGEPGGLNDKAGFAIWEPGADPSVDDPILVVPFDYTQRGNIQAHLDRVHVRLD